MMSIKRKIFITCKSATLLTCKKQDNALSFKEEMQLKIHLLVCTICSLFSKQSNLIDEQLKRMNAENYETNVLQLNEPTKIELQNKINSELEK